MRKDYDLVGSYDNQRITTINAERSVNLFEYLDEHGKRPKVLMPTAGLVDAELNFGLESGGARASFVFQNAIYNVYGSSVFRTTGTTDFLITTRIGELKDINGNITSISGYVGVDANTFQVIFVDGHLGWIWDTNALTFKPITDTGFPGAPIDVCYLDGFFLVANGGTNNFQLSEFNQGMVWSGGTATYTVNTLNSIITLNTNGFNFATGVPITVTTTGSLPPPLQLDTIYYVILISPPGTNPAQIRLATSYMNAINGLYITLTGAGTPTNTIKVNGELQLGSITSHPGTIVACRTLHRRIFLFSQNYTEVWENAGIGTNLPFRRTNSLLIEVGTPAIGSIALGFDRMFFLSQDRDGLAGVMEVQGSNAIHVSNRALDYQLAQYAADPEPGVSDARGILIKENGLIFYRLNFTAANHTFVLNVSMSTDDSPKWHEEEVLNGDRHPAQTHAYFDGVNYYGSYLGPKFYIVSDQISTNDGETIRRMRIGRQMTPEGYNRLRIDRFQIDVLQGADDIEMFVDNDLLTEDSSDILTESGSDIISEKQIGVGGGQPTVFLAISKDGGQTYGNYLHATMGKIGERTHRTVWRKLGTTPRGQGYVPKIEFFNEIPFIVLGAAWDFEVLPE